MNHILESVYPSVELCYPQITRAERFVSNKLSRKIYFPALSQAYKFFVPSYQSKLKKTA